MDAELDAAKLTEEAEKEIVAEINRGLLKLLEVRACVAFILWAPQGRVVLMDPAAHGLVSRLGDMIRSYGEYYAGSNHPPWNQTHANVHAQNSHGTVDLTLPFSRVRCSPIRMTSRNPWKELPLDAWKYSKPKAAPTYKLA